MFQLPAMAALVCACVALGARAEAQTVIHVDENADLMPNDGSDWRHAFPTLHEALAQQAAGVTIRVAGGAYLPSTAGLGNPREATFALNSGVTIEGGYAGCGAPNPNRRDIVTHETILSGDLGVSGMISDNCYHVLLVSGASATLDGLTITAGNADGGAGPNQGGGVLITNSSPTLRDCTLRQNHAQFGGGIFVAGGSPVLLRTVFVSNTATTSGGALYTYNTLVPPGPGITSCVFEDNTAGSSGGAVRNYDSIAAFADCSFRDNTTGYGGAGVANGGQGNPRFTRCYFAGNRTDTLFVVHDCFGGAMHNADSTRPTLESCVLFNNYAYSLLPGLSYGGAIATVDDAETRIVNCTLIDNYANVGPGLAGDGQAGTTVVSSILWNSGGEIADGGGATTVVTHSAVSAGWPGEGNITDVPLLDEWRLVPGSPCINAGDPEHDPSGVPDFAGHARVLCGRIDMGAHEFGIGDYDCDQVLDFNDFVQWPGCATGPDNGPHGSGCEVFDYESDGDVDIADFYVFQTGHPEH